MHIHLYLIYKVTDADVSRCRFVLQFGNLSQNLVISANIINIIFFNLSFVTLVFKILIVSYWVLIPFEPEFHITGMKM